MFLQSCCEDKPCLTNPGGTTPKDDARESDAQRIPETSHQDTLKTAGLEGRSTHLCCGIPPIAFLHLGCSIPRGVSEVPLGSFYLHALGSGTTLLHSLIALCVFQFHELHYFFYAGGELQGSPVWQALAGHTPVFLPGESQGRGSLVGCHLWGRTESDTTEAT